MNVFEKLFLVKEIKSKAGVLHFRRWRVIATPWFSVFVHNIYKADEDLHLHDHPWDYFNMILKGSYVEETAEGKHLMDVGCYSKRKAETFHKIHSVNEPTTTLFIIGKRRRDWGYSVDGMWVQHEKYREMKNRSRKNNTN